MEVLATLWDWRPRRSLVYLLPVALLAAIAARQLEGSPRPVHLTVECFGARCSASVDERPPIELQRPVSRRGSSVGLYTLFPWEGPAPQYFRELTLYGRSDLPLRHSLVDEHDVPDGLLDQGWYVKPGRGASSGVVAGRRAIGWLDDGIADFKLDVDLVGDADAGVIFDADRNGSGTVFAVLPGTGEARLFRIDRWRSGPVLASAATEEPRSGRELVRLAGLVAEILLAAGVFILFVQVLVARWAVPAPAEGRRRPVRTDPPPWCAPLLGIATLAVLAAVAWFGLSAVPHVSDETAHLFQAKIFAAGSLWAPVPAAPDFFRHEHIAMSAGKWFSTYPPFFAALLALGVLAGMPWIVNPMLGALVAWTTYRIAREVSDWRWGLVAWLLALSSPFFLIAGAAMTSDMLCALLVSQFVLWSVVGLRRRSAPLAALAGACLGLIVWTQPLTAVLVAAVVAAYAVGRWIAARDRRAVARAGLAMSLAAIPLLSGFLAWDALHIGPSGLSAPAAAASSMEVLRNTQHYLDDCARQVLGWPMRLSFALVLAGLCCAARRSTRGLLFGVFAALAAGHSLFGATQQAADGSRHWLAAFPLLIVLAVLGLRHLLQETIPTAGLSPRAALAVAAVVLTLVGANLGFYLPDRLHGLQKKTGISAELKREVADQLLENAVVFVSASGVSRNDGFFMNDPFFRGTRIFAQDLGPRNTELMSRYPDFREYRWNERSLVPLRTGRLEDVVVIPAMQEAGR